MLKKFIFLLSFMFLATLSTQAACKYKNKTPLTMLSAGFPAWKAVTAAMGECGNFTPELDQEYRTKQPAAFAAKPSLYQIGGVSNGTLVPLLDQGTVRPLDDLIAKYGSQLNKTQLIQIEGKTMAVAMMVNAQHLMFREDILKKLKIKTPKSYSNVLKAAEQIKKSGLVDYPLGGTYKAGWNLAQEFVNMYLGFGGSFFGKTNQATLNNKRGVKTLEMMKKLTAYMDPEYLQSDSTYVQKQFQQGKIALAQLWATRAAAMDNAEESKVVGLVKMAQAPKAQRGGKPATTLWWDGFVIAKNISDAQAEAAFRVAMEGTDKEMVQANNDTAVWLIDGFSAGALAKGAIESAEAGAPSYPASTQMSLMHSALGNNVADFLTGKKSAKEVLSAINKEYNQSAKEKGIL